MKVRPLVFIEMDTNKPEECGPRYYACDIVTAIRHALKDKEHIRKFNAKKLGEVIILDETKQ